MNDDGNIAQRSPHNPRRDRNTAPTTTIGQALRPASTYSAMAGTQSPRADTPGRSKGDEIAELVMARFGALQRKRKPAVRDGGVREWTTLSGVVVEREGGMRCVCLG